MDPGFLPGQKIVIAAKRNEWINLAIEIVGSCKATKGRATETTGGNVEVQGPGLLGVQGTKSMRLSGAAVAGAFFLTGEQVTLLSTYGSCEKRMADYRAGKPAIVIKNSRSVGHEINVTSVFNPKTSGFQPDLLTDQ